MKLKLIMLMGVFLLALAAQGQTIIGKWKTIDDVTGEEKSIVEITERNGKIYGKVTKLLNPDKQDTKCKDCPGDDKDKPVLGLEILKGLTKVGDKYTNGKILDPSNGKIYKCTASLDSKDNTKLNVRGYVGISMLGRTQVWHKVKEEQEK